MEVADFEESIEVQTAEELARFLARRFPIHEAKVNSFWLAHRDRFPAMGIFVRDDLAYVWYSPHEDCAGFVSLGSAPGLQQGEFTEFYFHREQQMVPNDSVVVLAEAMKAAQEFLVSDQRPTAVKWLEL